MRQQKEERIIRKTPTLRTARKLIRISSPITREELQRLAAEQPPPVERPEGLPLNEIHVAPNVFQWRLDNEELAEDEQHVWDLVRVIESGDKPRALDPMLVTAIGTRFFVLDGHHRIDAYHTAEWKGPVPAKYFLGTLKEAEDAALRLNSKNKLRMTRKSKTEAAWRMLVAGRKAQAYYRTWTEIMNLTAVGRGSLQRMTETLKQAEAWRASSDQNQRDRGASILNGTWENARQNMRESQHEAMDDDERADWSEAKARVLANHLLNGPSLIQSPGITARALEMVSGMLPELLVDQWIDQATERLLTEVAECLPDKAQAVEEVLAALRRLPSREVDKAKLPDTAHLSEGWDSL